MIPETGQHIKCLLRNNIFVEGILEEWFANMVKLKSLDGKSIIVITDPKDIMMFKVFLEKPEKEIEEFSEFTVPIPPTELEQEFQSVYEQPSDEPTRTKSLAELRVLMAEEERQNIVNKLRSHHIGETRKVKYGYPGFLSKPGAK